jgi:hypothetical protein
MGVAEIDAVLIKMGARGGERPAIYATSSR